MELTGKSVPKEGGVELSAFIEIIWKKKPGKMALRQGTPDFCFSPSTLRTAVRLVGLMLVLISWCALERWVFARKGWDQPAGTSCRTSAAVQTTQNQGIPR